MFAGLFHILFVMFDYSFNNPDTGAFTRLGEIANESLTGDHRTQYNDNSVMLGQFFGLGRIILIGVCLIFLAVGALDSKDG